MRCIALGDQLQEKNIRDNEEINIDMMWEVSKGSGLLYGVWDSVHWGELINMIRRLL